MTHAMPIFRRLAPAVLALSLGACDWFTDFKDQPRIEPWEAYASPGADTATLRKTAFRGQPQNSVPTTGSQAPGFWVSHVPGIAQLDSMSGLENPIPADERSLLNGRKHYQINCAVCHGEAGHGDGPATLYGMVPINIAGGPSLTHSDGYIFGIIRNGRGLMPTYNRIEEMDRWDVVNYIRGLQGRYAVETGALAAPGVNGAAVPGYSRTAPTLPPPYLPPGPLDQPIRPLDADAPATSGAPSTLPGAPAPALPGMAPATQGSGADASTAMQGGRD